MKRVALVLAFVIATFVGGAGGWFARPSRMTIAQPPPLPSYTTFKAALPGGPTEHVACWLAMTDRGAITLLFCEPEWP